MEELNNLVVSVRLLVEFERLALSNKALLVYITLHSRANANNVVVMSILEIKAVLGYSTNNVKKLIKHLEAAKVVFKTDMSTYQLRNEQYI